MNRIMTADVILTLTSVDAVTLHDAANSAASAYPAAHPLHAIYAGVRDLVRAQIERQYGNFQTFTASLDQPRGRA